MDLSLATPELKPRCFEIQSLTSSSMKVRDEGYSPSPNTEIDKDEGYSPSPGSISIFCDQNSLFLFQSFLGPESFRSRLCIFPQVFLCPPHFLSFLPQQDCVWLEFPVRGVFCTFVCFTGPIREFRIEARPELCKDKCH
jgi:hypothetical protein